MAKIQSRLHVKRSSQESVKGQRDKCYQAYYVSASLGYGCDNEYQFTDDAGSCLLKHQ